jgi:hypothetical protein
MALSSDIPTLNFTNAPAVLAALAQANAPVLLIGDPGVGKSALAQMTADILQASGAVTGLDVLLGSTLDPTDIPGIPFLNKEGTSVNRFPLEIIRRCAAEPRLLFLDEISCSTPAVQAAMLRLVLERVAGDTRLHKGTIIMAAMNPPEQAPGGFDISAPLTGRVAMFKFRPSHAEILDYMGQIGDEGTPLRMEAEDFALTAGAQPDLLQIDIPQDAITGGTKWGAPRDWERAIRSRAAVRASNGAQETMALVTEGSVGKRAAMTYEGILATRKVLPTVGEIVADPAKAKLPVNAKEQVAVLGVIAHVAAQNSWAAWIYAGRLDKPEYRQACAKVLQRKTPSAMTADHAKDGVQARVKLLASLPRMAAK